MLISSDQGSRSSGPLVAPQVGIVINTRCSAGAPITTNNAGVANGELTSVCLGLMDHLVTVVKRSVPATIEGLRRRTTVAASPSRKGSLVPDTPECCKVHAESWPPP